MRLFGWSTPEAALGQVVYQLSDGGGGLTASGALALQIIGVVEHAPLSFMMFGAQGTAFRLDPYATQPIVRLAADDVPADSRISSEYGRSSRAPRAAFPAQARPGSGSSTTRSTKLCAA